MRSAFALSATADNLRLRSRAEVGGSASESNRASPREQGATDFEDREGHRAPFASPTRIVPGRSELQSAGPGSAGPGCEKRKAILRSIGRRPPAVLSANPRA